MKRLLFLVGVVICAATAGRAAEAANEAAKAGWRELFNGRDLTGWKSNADPGAFTVVEGVLKAHATHPTNRGHLFFTGQRAEGLELFRNFELEAVVRGEPGANSGIFIHTDMETRDGRLHLKNGYEVQLNSSPTSSRSTARRSSTTPSRRASWRSGQTSGRAGCCGGRAGRLRSRRTTTRARFISRASACGSCRDPAGS